MPRKTQLNEAAQQRLEDASMRPRPDAAENGASAAGAGAGRGASMRPRPDAAENLRQRVGDALPDHDASMRPRPDAAENGRSRPRLPSVLGRLQ